MKKTFSRHFLCIALLLAVVGCQSSSRSKINQAAPEETPFSHKADIEAVRPDAMEVVSKAAAEKTTAFPGEGWESMFDGTSLTGWRVTSFAGAGEVEIKSGVIVLGMGSPFTGVHFTNDFPKMNYEVAFDAMRVDGSDFFCGLTFPVGDSFCSLICGGWGGAVTGLSSLDGADASENETTRFVNYERGRWYRIRLRVTEKKIEVWIDEKKQIDVETIGRKISLRAGEIEMSKPFGIASWETAGAFREIKLRHL